MKVGGKKIGGIWVIAIAGLAVALALVGMFYKGKTGSVTSTPAGFVTTSPSGVVSGPGGKAYLASSRGAGMMYGAGPGYMIPAGGPNITPLLTQATPYESASFLAGPYASELSYTLRNLRPLDYGQETAPSGGTLKSEGHSFANHGEATQKTADILRNSMMNIIPSVPSPIKVKLIVAGNEWRGSTYLGGIGQPRGAGN